MDNKDLFVKLLQERKAMKATKNSISEKIFKAAMLTLGLAFCTLFGHANEYEREQWDQKRWYENVEVRNVGHFHDGPMVHFSNGHPLPPESRLREHNMIPAPWEGGSQVAFVRARVQDPAAMAAVLTALRLGENVKIAVDNVNIWNGSRSFETDEGSRYLQVRAIELTSPHLEDRPISDELELRTYPPRSEVYSNVMVAGILVDSDNGKTTIKFAWESSTDRGQFEIISTVTEDPIAVQLALDRMVAGEQVTIHIRRSNDTRYLHTIQFYSPHATTGRAPYSE